MLGGAFPPTARPERRRAARLTKSPRSPRGPADEPLGCRAATSGFRFASSSALVRPSAVGLLLDRLHDSGSRQRRGRADGAPSRCLERPELILPDRVSQDRRREQEPAWAVRYCDHGEDGAAAPGEGSVASAARAAQAHEKLAIDSPVRFVLGDDHGGSRRPAGQTRELSIYGRRHAVGKETLSRVDEFGAPVVP